MKIDKLNPIARYILSVLYSNETARFRDLKPAKTASNHASYHLQRLVYDGYVSKIENQYSLTDIGSTLASELLDEKTERQPKIGISFVVQNGYGGVLLEKRQHQPDIGKWDLPGGSVDFEDQFLTAAADRVCRQMFSFKATDMRHVGICYLTKGAFARRPNETPATGMLGDGDDIPLRSEKYFRVYQKTLLHIFRFETDEVGNSDQYRWFEPLDLASEKLAPAVERIVTRSFFGDSFFFEEYLLENQNIR